MQATHVRRTLFTLVLAALCAAAAASASRSHTAGFPGKNGRIVFNDASGALVLVNPDGNGLVRIAGTQTSDGYVGASFSPDGTLIAYSRAVYGQSGGDADIFVIRPDGSSQKQI